MLKFASRKSYCFTLIVFVLKGKKRSKITIQNNIYSSRIQVAFLDTTIPVIDDAFRASVEKVLRISVFLKYFLKSLRSAIALNVSFYSG